MRWDKKRILEIDRRHIWHPYTQMKDYEGRDPVVITGARGLKLFTADGRELYDTISSWWANIHGHLHPALNRALAEQLEHLEHVNFSGFTHPWAAEVVERLRAFLPAALSRYFFSDNGSTAVEVALKMAFQYWQNRGETRRTRFLALREAYHGDTLGAVSVGGVDLFFRLYRPLTFEALRAPAPYCYRCPENPSPDFTRDAEDIDCNFHCVAVLESIVKEHCDEICAVIVEPRLLAAGGMIVYPAEYLRRLREITRRYGILLIFDEVATGFGRTGTMFAMESAGVVPDIVCLSKGLTAGYLPLALTVTTEEIYRAFYADYLEGKTFYHGHTFTANPLACAVAAANLRLFQEERPLERGRRVREFFHRRLLELFSGRPYVGDIRYLGYVGAVELVRDRTGREPFPPEKRVGFRIYMASLEEGLVLRPLGDVIYWFLPLCVTEGDLDEILTRSLRVMDRVIGEIS
ncbi:adenosylmethionine--8-amino-7-oxononanoate transaminase [Thermosulfurimonas sp. F29]|uniref:adenosylmethionine--8-amino-7-oxononanoate transaminase n=1 Tax=Thermosulfurimonas sp. F29 TaxID=2867247 RepID=UPI001C82FD07|nr:adenosylmethionine--8-amino-7-oxononanoate transaminase [Thermosulfurimonas sp. F29]MBX6423197.1 adenosylmethionine--8-amino-7-oxononanoate transaminase [Thermosulfurimonas sp. F29]